MDDAQDITLEGGTGQVTLLVDTLVASAGDLPIDGVGRHGRTLPSDPVPAHADPTAQHADATDHALSSPFLAYWRAHGGLDIIGYPRTEPFAEGRGAVQYTNRFRLELVAAAWSTTPSTPGRATPSRSACSACRRCASAVGCPDPSAKRRNKPKLAASHGVIAP